MDVFSYVYGLAYATLILSSITMAVWFVFAWQMSKYRKPKHEHFDQATFDQSMTTSDLKAKEKKEEERKAKEKDLTLKPTLVNEAVLGSLPTLLGALEILGGSICIIFIDNGTSDEAHYLEIALMMFVAALSTEIVLPQVLFAASFLRSLTYAEFQQLTKTNQNKKKVMKTPDESKTEGKPDELNGLIGKASNGSDLEANDGGNKSKTKNSSDTHSSDTFTSIIKQHVWSWMTLFIVVFIHVQVISKTTVSFTSHNDMIMMGGTGYDTIGAGLPILIFSEFNTLHFTLSAGAFFMIFRHLFEARWADKHKYKHQNVYVVYAAYGVLLLAQAVAIFGSILRLTHNIKTGLLLVMSAAILNMLVHWVGMFYSITRMKRNHHLFITSETDEEEAAGGGDKEIPPLTEKQILQILERFKGHL